jgi:hypothetical protein
MTTRQKDRPRTRRLAGSSGLLLALLVCSLAPGRAAACCNPATTAEAAICGSACCVDSSVCAPRTLETAAAATGISQKACPTLLESPIRMVIPAAQMRPLTRAACPLQASARPPLRDIPLLV